MAANSDELIHLRHCLFDYYRAGHSRHQATIEMQRQFGQEVPHRNWITKWWRHFENGETSLADKPRSGRPTTIDSHPVLQALENQPTSSLRSLERTTGVSRCTVSRILHNSGKVPRKPQVIPHDLTFGQKKQRVDTCVANLDHPHRSKLLNSLICQDGKWVYYSNPVHNPVWDVDAPPPTRAKREIHSKKLLLSFWFSRHGIVHYNLLPENTTVTSDTVTAELQVVKRKALLVSPNLARPTLLWDHARPHKAKATQAVLNTLGMD